MVGILRKTIFRYKNNSENNVSADEGKKAQKLADTSSEILFRTKTVFPFVFFPDELIIDKVKVNIEEGNFFASGREISIEYEDLLNVSVSYGPIFAHVTFMTKYFLPKPLIFKYLWKKDALKAKQLIQGIVICKQKGIDIAKMNADKIISCASTVGRGLDYNHLR